MIAAGYDALTGAPWSCSAAASAPSARPSTHSRPASPRGSRGSPSRNSPSTWAAPGSFGRVTHHQRQHQVAGLRRGAVPASRRRSSSGTPAPSSASGTLVPEGPRGPGCQLDRFHISRREPREELRMARADRPQSNGCQDGRPPVPIRGDLRRLDPVADHRRRGGHPGRHRRRDRADALPLPGAGSGGRGDPAPDALTVADSFRS